LTPCARLAHRRRRVDDGQLECPPLRCDKGFGQAALGQEFHMGHVAFATIRPDCCAFLLVKVKNNRSQSTGNCQIDGESRLTHPTLLCDQSYRFHNCSLSVFQVCIVSGVHT
jgi:hypothetical protein